MSVVYMLTILKTGSASLLTVERDLCPETVGVCAEISDWIHDTDIYHLTQNIRALPFLILQKLITQSPNSSFQGPYVSQRKDGFTKLAEMTFDSTVCSSGIRVNQPSIFSYIHLC